MNKVFLNSLPKSGTHLVAKLLEQIGMTFSNVNFSSSTIYGNHTLAKSILRAPLCGLASIDVGLDITAAARLSWMKSSLGKVGLGSYCGGHAPYSDALYTLLGSNDLKIIHMMRDPRDVLISWAHYVPKNDWHYGCEGLRNLSLDNRIRNILYGYESGNFILESFNNILHRSSGWEEHKNVLLVRFEDLVGEKGGGDSEKQLQNVGNIIDFVGAESIDTSYVASSLFGGTKVFRKGQVGAWKEGLSINLIDEINEKLEKKIVQMGYKV